MNERAGGQYAGCRRHAEAHRHASRQQVERRRHYASGRQPFSASMTITHVTILSTATLAPQMVVSKITNADLLLIYYTRAIRRAGRCDADDYFAILEAACGAISRSRSRFGGDEEGNRHSKARFRLAPGCRKCDASTPEGHGSSYIGYGKSQHACRSGAVTEAIVDVRARRAGRTGQMMMLPSFRVSYSADYYCYADSASARASRHMAQKSLPARPQLATERILRDYSLRYFARKRPGQPAWPLHKNKRIRHWPRFV